jgi:hypothetical protein
MTSPPHWETIEGCPRLMPNWTDPPPRCVHDIPRDQFCVECFLLAPDPPA